MIIFIRIIILIVIGTLNYFPVIAQNQYSNYKAAIQKIDAHAKEMRPVPPCSGPISRNENQLSEDVNKKLIGLKRNFEVTGCF